MAENSGQEKTEQATPRRLEQAREKGQVTRSRDLNATVLLLGGCMLMMFMSESIQDDFSFIMSSAFTVDRTALYDLNILSQHISNLANKALMSMTPFLLMMLAFVFVGPGLLGGVNIRPKALGFKGERLSPLKGIKRIFSLKSLVELIKAFAKFSVVAVCGFLIVLKLFPRMLDLGHHAIDVALYEAMSYIMWSSLAVSASLLIIVLFDVPFQIWQYTQELKMTKQEVREEYKEVEGKPEVKSQIRKMQYSLSQKRMMEAVPDADVIITNPTHYAVALKYDEKSSQAPVVVAKGQELIALKIKTEGNKHNRPIVESPRLARAIFYSTKLNHEIPQGLFIAVAQVLAYVYQLKRYRRGEIEKPKLDTNLEIPPEFITEPPGNAEGDA